MNRRDEIRKTLRGGKAVLITGAGFSADLTSRSGKRLPLGTSLSRTLWGIAFPGEDFEDGNQLQDIYEEAQRKSPSGVMAVLSDRFSVDSKSIPPRFSEWMSLPWHRMYTLNVDDSMEKVFPDGRLESVSALTAMPGSMLSEKSYYIHLNGRFCDYPRVTFSTTDFAQRTARHDVWYTQFVAEILTRPVFIVGAEMNESPLWHYLRLAQTDGASGFRPKSYIVSPSLPISRRAQLAALNFEHIAMTEKEFFGEFCEGISSGDIHPMRAAKSSAISLVDEAIANAAEGGADFLLGMDPTWGDVTRGFAVEFEADRALARQLSEGDEAVNVVVGVAGSGKTSTLMRLAARRSSSGCAVGWVNSDFSGKLRSLSLEVEKLGLDFLFIDDVDRFAHSAVEVVDELLRESPEIRIVLSCRSNRFSDLQYGEVSSWRRFNLDRLIQEDVEALLESLTRANRLGSLRGVSREAQLKKLDRADRYLIVALIEATSNQSFHDKISEECGELTEIPSRVYGLVCTATKADRMKLSDEDVLIASAGAGVLPADIIKTLKGMEEGGLLRRDSRTEGLSARHRVVAEEAIDHFRKKRQISTWFVDLVALCAVKYEAPKATQTKYGRLLKRLVNHDFIQSLLIDRDVIRQTYGSCESYLKDDPHFWLQRGSYEARYGDLTLAENFLSQARALNERDDLVQTAWSALMLQQALRNPSDYRSASKASDGLAELLDVIRRRGASSPHAYREFLNFGLQWWEVGGGDYAERRRLGDDLSRIAQLARKTLANNPPVVRAAENVQRVFASRGS